MNILGFLLYPLSLIYGIITWLRNKFFDWGILPVYQPEHAVIGVGNLSVGGSGKTPMVEYIIRLLKNKGHSVSTLSRGYRRKTRGFVLAESHSTVSEIGDEPLQLSLKFPDVKVAVCGSRKKGIKKLSEVNERNSVIILDDAFQHRYVKPGLNILLTDYHKIFTRNYVLPSGNLREFRSGVSRADILVVTKTPGVLSPLDKNLIIKEIEKYKIKNVFFSYVKYGCWVPMTPSAQRLKHKKAKTIFMLTGIANPVPLAEHLKRHCQELRTFAFADHHAFTSHDILKVIGKFNDTYSGDKVIVTTEKDSMRMQTPEIRRLITHVPVYYIPIETAFHNGDQMKFDNLMLEYVNSLSKGSAKTINKKRPKSNRENAVI